jgi:predicted PurR-regulated permease PerM
MNRPSPAYDLTRIVLGVAFLFLLVAASFWVLRPFLPAFIWATMVVIATWPLMRAVQARLWGRRGLAVAVMTTLFLLVFVIPLWLALSIIVEHTDDVAEISRSFVVMKIPMPPEWLAGLPVVGGRLAAFWTEIAASTPEQITERLLPYARVAGTWVVVQAGGFGKLVLHFLLTVVIAAILYGSGENAAAAVRRFARRLAGERGEHAAVLAGNAIRAVAMGVVVTAIVQSTLAGVGLAMAGVPFAGLLTAVAFVLCIAQLGPALVLFPAVGWLFWRGDVMWGSVLLVWSIVVGLLDNVLRPWLIKRGADLPLLLILVGVIGGLLAFGVIGLFVGPVLLAVTYTLLQAWVAETDAAPMIPVASPGDAHARRADHAETDVK